MFLAQRIYLSTHILGEMILPIAYFFLKEKRKNPRLVIRNQLDGVQGTIMDMCQWLEIYQAYCIWQVKKGKISKTFTHHDTSFVGKEIHIRE